MADILEQLIGVRTGTRNHHSRSQPRGDNVIHQVDVTLEEIYNGATRCVAAQLCMRSQRELGLITPAFSLLVQEYYCG